MRAILATALTLAVVLTGAPARAEDQRLSVDTGETRQVLIMRGGLPITTERFVQLLEIEGVAPVLTERVKKKGELARSMMLLGGIGIPFCFVFPGRMTLDNQFGVMTASMLGTSLVLGGAWTLVETLIPPYSVSEAQDACDAYNRRLSAP